MLIDTHCHINMMIKEKFDELITNNQLFLAEAIINQAQQSTVLKIINVGTSYRESINCVTLATQYAACYAAIGIHPNDCTATWHIDLKEMEQRWFQQTTTRHKEFKIVAIGECGLDRHYPDYNMMRQKDAFRAQIELALTFCLPVIVHTRDAGDETLRVLEEYIPNNIKGVIHCFSEDQSFANTVLEWGFLLGIGGPLTYPKNNALRDIFKTVPLETIVLETDAPFLPIQQMRGKQNHPKYIADIAEFLAQLRNESIETVAQITTKNATKLFLFE